MAGIRHGDRVYATEDLTFTYPKRKPSIIKVGTRGRVRGLRELETDDCRKALVKFEGFGWPKQVNISQISKTRPGGKRKGSSVRQTAELHLEVMLHVLLPKGLKWNGEHLWEDVESRVFAKLVGQNVMLRAGTNQKSMGRILKGHVEVVQGSRA